MQERLYPLFFVERHRILQRCSENRRVNPTVFAPINDLLGVVDFLESIKKNPDPDNLIKAIKGWDHAKLVLADVLHEM